MADTATGETVTTTTPATGRNAFDAARASLAQSAQSDQGDETPAPPSSDDTPAETPEQPAEETEKVADQPTGATEDTDALLSAEESRQLTGKAKTLYEKAQANYTKKTQRLAAERKELEQWKPLVEALRTNPDAAIEQMARQRGLTIQRADAQDNSSNETVQAATAQVLSTMPPEAQALAPYFEQFGKIIMSTVEQKLRPIEEVQTQMISEAAVAETEATLKAMDADPDYKDWKKYEAKMVDIGKRLVPTAGSMTDLEYMKMLYRLATEDVRKAESVKEAVKAINKSVAASEPRETGTLDKRVEHAMPPPDKRSIKDAWEAARQGIVWTK